MPSYFNFIGHGGAITWTAATGKHLSLADKPGVSWLAKQTREVLEIAAAAGRESAEDTAILIGREGGMLVKPSAGWSVSGLLTEYGAVAVYKVERRGAMVRVEGGNGIERCVVERECCRQRPVRPLRPLLALPAVG